jgi:hypothetical protein
MSNLAYLQGGLEGAEVGLAKTHGSWRQFQEYGTVILVAKLGNAAVGVPAVQKLMVSRLGWSALIYLSASTPAPAFAPRRSGQGSSGWRSYYGVRLLAYLRSLPPGCTTYTLGQYSAAPLDPHRT